MKNEFITYGFFIENKNFKEITNGRSYLNKPMGGLWGSPLDSEFSWKDWCLINDFRVNSLNVYTKWKLKNPEKLLIIDSYSDLEKIMDKYGFFNMVTYNLDFSKIKNDGYIGMMLTTKGNFECHLPMKLYRGKYHIDLNTWDCESLVVWELNQIEVIEIC